MNIKFRIHLFSTILFIILTAACSEAPGERWPLLPPEAEAICDSLENLYINDEAVRKGSDLISLLDSLTVHEKNPSRRARVLYWKSMTSDAGSDSVFIWLHQAREMIDSAKYPYMHARIVMEDTKFDNSSYLKRYQELRKTIFFFAGAGDKMMELFSYRVLSSFYIRIGDLDGFRQCAETIDSICREMKMESLTVKNQINFVFSYAHSGDTVKAMQILNNLLESQYIRSDSDFMGRLYVNRANLTSDPNDYLKAIEVSPTFRHTPHMRHTLQFGMMKTYEANGDLYHADSILNELAPIVERDGDYEAKGIMHAMYSRQARQHGDYRRALSESEISRLYFDSTYSSDERIKVTQSTFKDEIARLEVERERERLLSSTRLIASITVLVLCCLLLWFYYKGRQNKMLAKQYASEANMARLNLDLEKEKRTVAAMGLAMNERDNLIEDVMKMANQLHADGAISADAKVAIGHLVKLSQYNQQEWENFQIAYSRANPHFISRLKEQYPGISEGDTRLALYISAGLNSKQIAQAMHIQPDSVKKNRQRLRQRMKISPEASLEDELRKLL